MYRHRRDVKKGTHALGLRDEPNAALGVAASLRILSRDCSVSGNVHETAACG